MIAFNRVSYRFEEETLALDKVSFTLREGEFAGLLASNGGGKTTLLRLAAGLLSPTSGDIHLISPDGARRSTSSIPDRELYRRIGFVMQNPADQLIAPTVGEDVAFGPRNMGLSEAEVQERVEESLERVGILHLAHRDVHRISFGESRRAAIAGILAMRPKLILLDEPTAGLDPAGESSLLRLLSELNTQGGLTVLMATHTIDLLPLFMDRLLVLTSGRLAADGTPAEVFADRKAMLAAGLRVPYVASLLDDLREQDGLAVESALTIGEARRRLVESVEKRCHSSTS